MQAAQWAMSETEATKTGCICYLLLLNRKKDWQRWLWLRPGSSRGGGAPKVDIRLAAGPTATHISGR
jgi:hypothetical protein